MIQRCVCNEHEFNFNLDDDDVKCPKCSREYFVFMDADDDGNFYYDLILNKEVAIA